MPSRLLQDRKQREALLFYLSTRNVKEKDLFARDSIMIDLLIRPLDAMIALSDEASKARYQREHSYSDALLHPEGGVSLDAIAAQADKADKSLQSVAQRAEPVQRQLREGIVACFPDFAQRPSLPGTPDPLSPKTAAATLLEQMDKYLTGTGVRFC